MSDGKDFEDGMSCGMVIGAILMGVVLLLVLAAIYAPR